MSGNPNTHKVNRTQRTHALVYKMLYIAGFAAAGAATICICLILAYRFVNPPLSTLMAAQVLTGTTIHKTWVPLERISPHLVRSVIMSEDAQFCRHWGVDLGAIYEAIERSRQGGPIRGTSTISMQVVKNLFLWPQRSYVRKALEVPLGVTADLVWSKRRMLEIYLNIAEWGPGIFGAEAAARYYFKKPVARLSPDQSALLAISLPNPRARRPNRPSRLMKRLAARIITRSKVADNYIQCLKS
ncbi:MAG: monofunctional biosynthetic peptidoglycan transglycosylase [Pseudomonadota bacterium]